MATSPARALPLLLRDRTLPEHLTPHITVDQVGAGGANVRAFLEMLTVSEGAAAREMAAMRSTSVAGWLSATTSARTLRWGWSDVAGGYQITAAIPGRIRMDTWDWASRRHLLSRRIAPLDLKAGCEALMARFNPKSSGPAEHRAVEEASRKCE